MSEKKNTLIKALFYGSLRAGEYNCESFKRAYGEDSMQYQGTKTIEGYQLYSLGAYPMILKEKGAQLVVDEFLVSPEAFMSIRRMELGAGYNEEQIDGAYIYYFDQESSDRPKVESGDWSVYLSEKQNQKSYSY